MKVKWLLIPQFQLNRWIEAQTKTFYFLFVYEQIINRHFYVPTMLILLTILPCTYISFINDLLPNYIYA